MAARQKRLCVIITSALSLKLFRNQWQFWQDNGWDISCIAGTGKMEHDNVRRLGVKSFEIPMERNPNIIKDFISLVRLWWFFLWHRFDVLHISTPKASFLGSIAGRMSGHNKIYYLLRGRPYENMNGIKRKIICLCEFITCRLSTFVVPICKEMGLTVVKEGLCSEQKIKYIGSGSSAGVDLDIYSGRAYFYQERKKIRTIYGFSEKDIVFIYAGWFRRDKGINELVESFMKLRNKYSNIKLLLLGDYELSDPLDKTTIDAIVNDTYIIVVKWVKSPVEYYAAADILAFPSYREGFGNVIIEASAMELPVAASNIMGCREAVIDGETGLLFDINSIESIIETFERLILNPDLRTKLGKNGRARVIDKFDRKKIYYETNSLMESLIK